MSGSVERGEVPEETAWRELVEETGLLSGHLRPIRAGLAVDIDDTHKKKSYAFRVHPFLYELASEVAPRLSSEHVEARWVEPDEVIALAASGETVPELDETLARVWDPPAALPPQYRPEARAIFDDRLSGATELAKRAAVLVWAGAPAERVAALRPTMASLVNAARAAGRTDRNVLVELAQAVDRAAASARSLLVEGLRVATISRSSTLLMALDGAPKIRLTVGISLPGGEGELLAAKARELGHTAELEEDGWLCERVAGAQFDLVLIGADAVTANGDVVNKVGSRALAKAAAGKTPFVVAADEWKRWDDEVPPPLEPIFELVPAKWVTRIVG